MFDLKGFRKDRKLSQKQISQIIGIGTSFISQIETGKDPMPGYVPDKLISAYGKEEVEKYYREPSPAATRYENPLRKAHYNRGEKDYYSTKKLTESDISFDTINPEIIAYANKTNSEWINRVLTALERRDELAMSQQKEYERQGARIDELLAFLGS